MSRPRVIAVLPAYNAEKTLEKTYADIPNDFVDDVILVDDASRDRTVEIARRLGIHVVVHPRNRGYGANQKTCYRTALERGADLPAPRPARRRPAAPTADHPVPATAPVRRAASRLARRSDRSLG